MSYVNYWMLPPAGGHTATLPGNGRVYTGADGVPQAVPDFDCTELSQQGPANNKWTCLINAPCGATTARPANPASQEQFLDLTLGKIITWHPYLKAWVDPATGAQV